YARERFWIYIVIQPFGIRRPGVPIGERRERARLWPSRVGSASHFFEVWLDATVKMARFFRRGIDWWPAQTRETVLRSPVSIPLRFTAAGGASFRVAAATDSR